MHERPAVDRSETEEGQSCGDGGGRGDETERAVANGVVTLQHAIEHLRGENDDREDPHHGEFFGIADGRGDPRLVQKLQQRRVSAEGKYRRENADQQDEAPAARPYERAANAKSDGENPDIDTE